jgi:TRAP-type C4-dicarboxylate transport system substrate-binding protein
MIQGSVDPEHEHHRMEEAMRRKRSVLFIIVIMIVGSLTFGTLQPAAAKDVYRMRVQSAYPHGDVSMELLKDFAKWAKEASDGQILISVFALGDVVPAEQMFEACQKGTLDMIHAVAAMWAGIVPVGEVEFGLPFAYNIPGDKGIVETGAILRRFFFHSGFVDLLREEYGKQGLYWLDMHSYGRLFTMSTAPIVTCEDIKGKKFRVEGSWAQYYDMVGAQGTYIDGSEAYMGLKMGTIDASQWDVSAITGLKWHEVAPYWLIGGQNDVVPGHILVNMTTWNSLPDDLKRVMSDVAEEYYHQLLKVYVDEMEKVYKLVKAGKVKISKLDDACEKKHEEAAYELWAEIAARDEAAARAIEMIKEWRKTLK